jgi:CRP/FNR family transcriptional regulator, cyclic AMP receptor protein
MELVEPPDIAAYRQQWPAQAFLSRISVPEASDYFAAGHFAQFAPKEIMIREHADDQVVYLMISGCVKVFSEKTTDSCGALLAIRIGGDIVGELSAMDRRRRSANVAVCSRQPALVCVVERTAFMDVLTRHPRTHMVLSSVIGAKLRAATRRRADIARNSPVVRMARLLVELADDYGQPSHDRRGVLIGIKLSQIELGSLIGVSGPTAQRALRHLRAMGLIDTSGRPLIIHDMKRLRAVAASPSNDGGVEPGEA